MFRAYLKSRLFLFLGSVLLVFGSTVKAQPVYIQSVTQGPNVANPTFIFIKIKPSPAECPQVNVARLSWNNSVYKALLDSMGYGRPINLVLRDPVCVNMGNKNYINLANVELLPKQAAPVKPAAPIKPAGKPSKGFKKPRDLKPVRPVAN